MNTPRTKFPRRSHPKPDFNNITRRGVSVLSLIEPDYAVYFTAMVTEFEHLEMNMAKVLAVLMATPDHERCGYILRANKSARARREMMRALLEQDPRNAAISTDYDLIVDEYASLTGERNKYVHGLWWTDTLTEEVRFAAPDEDLFTHFDQKPLAIEELKEVLDRIRMLTVRVLTRTGPDLALLRQQAKQVQQSASPKEVNPQPRHSGPKLPPPRPPPSRASPQKRVRKPRKG